MREPSLSPKPHGAPARAAAAAPLLTLAAGAAFLAASAAFLAPGPTSAQSVAPDPDAFPVATPVEQSARTVGEPSDGATAVSLRDASRPDRWLGVEPREVRWAPDGSGVYFRWHPDPDPDGDPELDPWFFVDGEGREVERVPREVAHRIPSSQVSWSEDRSRAAWAREGRVYLYDAEREAEPAEGTGDEAGRAAAGLSGVRVVFGGPGSAGDVRVAPDGGHVGFTVEEARLRYRPDDGSVRWMTRRHEPEEKRDGEFAEWLRDEELELMEQHRRDLRREEERTAHERLLEAEGPQPLPVDPDARLSGIRVSPGERYVTFRWTRSPADRERVRYAEYAARSGYTEVHRARPKAGEPRDENRFGVVEVSPETPPDSVEVTWLELPAAEDRDVVVHGPSWSPNGERAVLQVLSRDHKDLWIAELDPATGEATALVHDHDPAWLGGPPPQAGRLQPGLLEWLDDDRFVFASERTGWSHLHLADLSDREPAVGSPSGSAPSDDELRPLAAAEPREAHAAPGVEVVALTEGAWEVRGAELSPERDRWLITGSREHPSEDHVYLLPADGGELSRISEGTGRFTPHLSPDGSRAAVLHSDAVSLPDLYLRELGAEPGARGPGEMARVTESGTDAYHERALVRPEMVSFQHPDGDPVWAALFLPPEPNEERAAVMHIHGGGYRQFAHRGWSVYGWAQHVGFINHLLEEGYVVLDFDYRGSAGFGRDYRTDIYRGMGHSDVEGAVAGVDWLAEEHGVDPDRVGMYGLSYGGFFTLMSLFRHPGVFAAGVSDDGVTDWAHYSDGWTTRILNRPQDDPEAYRRSSPIHHAEGLEDPLLISHGVIDDNVHFQDATRLVQRLIELEKDFEVMYYPLERHGFRTESSRYDYYRRVDAHFRRHLLER